MPTHGLGEAFRFAFLDAEHARALGDPGQVARPRSHYHQRPPGTEDTGELRRIPRRKDHHDGVHGVIGQGQGAPDVPDEVGHLRIQPGSPPKGELGDVQAYGRSAGSLYGLMQVMARSRPSVKDEGLRPVEHRPH